MTQPGQKGRTTDTAAKPASALETIIAEAEAFRRNAQKKGSVNLAGYYTIGAVGVIAGILASAGNSLPHLITVLVGLVAAGAVAMQTFLRRQEKSRFQYDNGADAGAIALSGRILADRERPPTEDELLDLVNRLTEIRLRPFEHGAGRHQ
jgi:hypothetical protein